MILLFYTSDKIRLVGGRNHSEGRVEVYYDDQWGRVCSDGWEQVDADVVCKQVGFSNGAREIPSPGRFGNSSGQVWLDGIACNGSEKYLRDCVHSGWGDHNCAANGDAAVICIGESM